jgi:hypothetical protein
VVLALEGLPGVIKADASFAEKRVVVRYVRSSVSLAQIKEALLKAGYVASLADNPKRNQNIAISGSDPKSEFQPDDLVCFCFQYTRKDIERDYIANGRSTILAKIAAEKKAGRCDCALKNPKGL